MGQTGNLTGPLVRDWQGMWRDSRWALEVKASNSQDLGYLCKNWINQRKFSIEQLSQYCSSKKAGQSPLQGRDKRSHRAKEKINNRISWKNSSIKLMLLGKFVPPGLYCSHSWITIISEACRNAPKDQYKHSDNNPVPLESGTCLITGVFPIP